MSTPPPSSSFLPPQARIAQNCKKRLNDEKSQGKSASSKCQRKQGTRGSKEQRTSCSHVNVTSAARSNVCACGEASGSVVAVQTVNCEASPEDTWPDTDSDLGYLHDLRSKRARERRCAGSAVTVCVRVTSKNSWARGTMQLHQDARQRRWVEREGYL